MEFLSKFLAVAKPKIDKGSYLAFQLSPASREEIINNFTPKYKKVVCDHITLEYDNPSAELEAQFKNASLEVVGYQFGAGVDCVVVSVNGAVRRPDGGIFHVTLSLKGGHKPVESNAILKQQGYNLVVPFPIQGTLEMLPK